MPSALPSMILALAAGTSPDPLPSQGDLHFPPTSRVLYVFDGEEHEHLGIGLALLGDVDGDGVGDLALGTRQDATAVCFAPGCVRVVSGGTGTTIYRLEGAAGESGELGDTFGNAIYALGDLDQDGVPDFAVFASQWEGHRGCVAIRSGCNGAPLATLYGPSARDEEPTVRVYEAPRPPRSIDDFTEGGFGVGVVALRDANGDHVEDFSVGDFLFSGADFRVLRRLANTPLAYTGDFDADGAGDVLERPAYGRHRELMAVIGAPDGRELATLAVPSVPAIQREPASPVGDVDGDGFVDLVFQTRELDRPGALDPWVRVIRRARVWSGRDGTLLLDWTLDHPDLDQVHVPVGVGDLDGDGKGEI